MASQKEPVNGEPQSPMNEPKKIATESKKNYELIWKIIFIFISIFSAFLINKIYQYQTRIEFQPIRKGSVYQLLLYGPIIGFVIIYLETLGHARLDDKCDKYYLSYERYQTQEARKKRSYTLIKWAYSLVYYATTTISAYFILKDTSFMPTWLGGNGYCTDVTRYVSSLDEANLSMKVFYVVQFGKHVGRFFHHVFVRSQGNFYEYALHHGLSTFLIFFSYLMNMWLIGIFVLFIHDFSDFFLILGRAYRDYKHFNRIVINILYYIGGSAWIICRIFLLSYCCVYSSLSSAYEFIVERDTYPALTFDVILVPGMFMGFMLFALEILQVFWTYYIITAFIEISVSSKLAKNTYEA